MIPSKLSRYLQFAIRNRFPILIKGKPGVGKTDIIEDAASTANAHLIVTHPVISEPTDFKGLPFPKKDGTADFLPYGDLKLITTTKEELVYLFDDLGQAPASVQAACMQLLLSRKINGHKVSDSVVFIAATNRKGDGAGVSGILNPVKSRFISIQQLDVSADDWISWALDHNMPTELIAFVRFRPELLEDAVATKEIENTACPRTVENLGLQQIAGIDKDLELEAFTGAAGEAFGIEYHGFLTMYRDLPTIDEIVLNPGSAAVPNRPGALYAVSSLIAKKMTDQNISPACDYLTRLPMELQVACMQDASKRNQKICNNRAFIKWSTKITPAIL